jgi:hypothetical protein
MKRLAAAAALVLCSTVVQAQTFTHRGFAEGRFLAFPQTTVTDGTRAIADGLLREEVFVTPPTWAWLQFAAGLDLRGNSHDQVENAIDIGDRSLRRPSVSIRRLSATVNYGRFTADIGKQFIRWARADVINPIDRFAPRNYLNVVDTEFLPVSGVRPSVQIGNETLEAVWTWHLTPSRMPLLDQRWTTLPPEAAGISIEDAGSRFPARGQVGARWRHTGGRVEWGLSLFDGFTHHPHVQATPIMPPVVPPGPVPDANEGDGASEETPDDPDASNGDAVITNIEITRTFPRLRMYAVDTAIPTRWLTFKAEWAYFAPPDHALRSYTLFVLEVERQLGEWLLTGGYAGETNAESAPPLAFDPERAIAPAFVGRASYTVDPRRTIAVEFAARQNGDGQYFKGDYSHAIRQRWRATVTAIVLSGSNDDFLGQFDRNSHLTTALRFSF